MHILIDNKFVSYLERNKEIVRLDILGLHTPNERPFYLFASEPGFEKIQEHSKGKSPAPFLRGFVPML